MPFKNEAQEKALWANAPEVARRWTKKYGSLRKKRRRRNAQKRGEKKS